MTTEKDREAEQAPEGAGVFRQVVIDEPLQAWVGWYGRTDVDEALRACSRLQKLGNLTLVLRLPPASSPAHAFSALVRAGVSVGTFVLVASEDDRRLWGALTESDLRALARGGGARSILVEPDPKRAVIGAMQWLEPHDTFCVLWPNEPDRPALEAYVASGAAWRCSWDEPENGELHDGPRGAGGELLALWQTPPDPIKQGEDR